MKERFESPFESDAEAQAVIDSDDMVDKWATDWRQFENLPAEIGLDGNFTVAQLMALIHFHPVLKKERDEGVVVKSDEVRMLELSVQKLTEHLNALLEVIDPEKTWGQTLDQQYTGLKREIMKARACLPAGYSMSLTKKENKDGV